MNRDDFDPEDPLANLDQDIDDGVNDEKPSVERSAKDRIKRQRRSSTIQWQGNPDWRGMIYWYIKGALIILAAAALAYGLRSAGVLAIGHVVAITIVLLIAIGFIGYLKRRMTVYTVTPSRLSMKTGIINIRTEQAPLDKINNIIVQQNLAQRIMGIGNIDIDTANEKSGIMEWWAVKDPGHVERLIDDLRDDISFSDDDIDEW